MSQLIQDMPDRIFKADRRQHFVNNPLIARGSLDFQINTRSDGVLHKKMVNLYESYNNMQSLYIAGN